MSDECKELDTILREFHSHAFRLIKLLKKEYPDNIEVDWLRQRASLARSIDPFLIINRCKDKFWYYRKEILSKNADFFMNNKFSKFIKNDENKTFMYTLVNIIKNKAKELSTEEMDYLWGITQDMLISVIKYKKLIKDYDE